MRQFYQSTYYLWIVTKGIFAFAVMISAISNLGISNLRGPEKMVNFIGLVYAILLVIDIIISLKGSYSKPLKYTIGVISVLMGIGLLILPFLANVISVPLTFIFAAWIILLGFFDLLIIKRRSLEDEE